MIQLAWGFLMHQKDSRLADWYRTRTTDARGGTRKTMIVALARKLLPPYSCQCVLCRAQRWMGDDTDPPHLIALQMSEWCG